MTRRNSWTNRVFAKPEALAFYKALEAAHKANAFEDCHIFVGAKGKDGPVIWDPIKNYAAKASRFIAHFIGLDVKGRRRCSTEGCINPTHWGPMNPDEDVSLDYPSQLLFPRDLKSLRIARKPSVQDTSLQQAPFSTVIPIQDWVDMIEYIRESRQILQGLTYKEYRDMIPEEDISSDHLPAVFDALPQTWKKTAL